MFISAFSNNLIQTCGALAIQFKRWKDKGWRSNLKYDLEDEDNDMPNSRIKIQEDLEKLYTGP